MEPLDSIDATIGHSQRYRVPIPLISLQKKQHHADESKLAVFFAVLFSVRLRSSS